MPRIFDNIEELLLPALQTTLGLAYRADFCVGYLNLRGWKQLAPLVEEWPGGPDSCCRLLIGMQRPPQEQLRLALTNSDPLDQISNRVANELRKELAEQFRHQLTIGIPTNDDEAGLRNLARQIRAGKVQVRLFLRHPLHAKLYLLFRSDPINPIVGYLGSSNLTMAGLARQGELNVDVLDSDACSKLARWFQDRWEDRWSLDISHELATIIEESWAREELIAPYLIYLKMAYHLSQEARAGLAEFRLPREFAAQLFDYQAAAVKIAAHHLNRRGGVLIGDVVGLGKTLMATALARVFEDDYGLETLVICPKNLTSMWQHYCHRYRLRARVLPLSQVIRDLPGLERYRQVIIDESHNLRNPQSKRYRAIYDYVARNESRCILLSATPYNKTYLDLSSQLGLFIPPDAQLPIRPERLLREMGLIEFSRRHQCSPRSLEAFEKSEHIDDWRELMRLYMVRRTRTFIQSNYAQADEQGRKFLPYPDGRRLYFPRRAPKTVRFAIDAQYERLYADEVVDTINDLALPRYGLANYVLPDLPQAPTPDEAGIMADLSRAGPRLKGFCRTGLFKRLESSGEVFLQSLQRHILRNHVFLHALERGLPLPIGTQDAALLDTRLSDADADDLLGATVEEDADDASAPEAALSSQGDLRARAEGIYNLYRGPFRTRFRWLRPDFFHPQLQEDLRRDAEALQRILDRSGPWDPAGDAKLHALHDLLAHRHAGQKVLVFTQYADTVRYVEAQLAARQVSALAGVCGDSEDPTALAFRFSPESNEQRERITPERELRVLVTTDVLSEGQNLQDCAIVVNYDLPWAIIRLTQRAGRVDRIGQRADEILCYTFLPAEGVERIIRLRARVRQRLRENAEVLGTDEAFFEDDDAPQTLVDLYNERAGLLDGEEDTEVDLTSQAYQIWKNAIAADPRLERIVPALPNVAYTAKAHRPTPQEPAGALVFLRTEDGTDALLWVDRDGQVVSESEYAILRAAECRPETPAVCRAPNHHDLTRQAVAHAARSQVAGGQLGRPTGARFRTYERLRSFAERHRGTLWVTAALHKAIEQILRSPLQQTATDTLNRQLRSGISDEDLALLVATLYEEGRLCTVEESDEPREPRIICSLGLVEE